MKESFCGGEVGMNQDMDRPQQLVTSDWTHPCCGWKASYLLGCELTIEGPIPGKIDEIDVWSVGSEVSAHFKR